MAQHKATQEDLNAVHQGLRMFGFLNRLEPLIRDTLVLEEQAAKAKSELNAAVKERDQVKAEIAQLREAHEEELRAMKAEKEAAIETIAQEIDDERRNLNANLKDEMADETKKAEAALRASLKQLAESVAEEEKTLAAKQRQAAALSEEVKALEKQKADLGAVVKQLTEKAEKAEQDKKQIREMLEKLAAQQ